VKSHALWRRVEEAASRQTAGAGDPAWPSECGEKLRRLGEITLVISLFMPVDTPLRKWFSRLLRAELKRLEAGLR
jgi:hypothetical protein